MWTLALAYQTAVTGRDRDAVLTGGLLALLALTDPILALAMAGVVWAICSNPASAWLKCRHSLRLIAVIAVVALAGIVSVASAQRHGSRRIRPDQEHLRLCILAGQLRLSEGTDKVVRPLGRASIWREPGNRSTSRA